MFLVAADGRAWHAERRDTSWREIAPVGGPPAAFDSGRPGELLVALHDGTINSSTDAGDSWTIRSQP